MSLPFHFWRKRGAESLAEILLYVIVTSVMIGMAMHLGRRTGLGAPFLEGVFGKGDSLQWLRRSATISCAGAIVVGFLISAPALLVRDATVEPERLIAPWKCLLASIDAGIQGNCSTVSF